MRANLAALDLMVAKLSILLLIQIFNTDQFKLSWTDTILGAAQWINIYIQFN